jgi:hypothetical protein
MQIQEFFVEQAIPVVLGVLVVACQWIYQTSKNWLALPILFFILLTFAITLCFAHNLRRWLWRLLTCRKKKKEHGSLPVMPLPSEEPHAHEQEQEQQERQHPVPLMRLPSRLLGRMGKAGAARKAADEPAIIVTQDFDLDTPGPSSMELVGLADSHEGGDLRPSTRSPIHSSPPPLEEEQKGHDRREVVVMTAVSLDDDESLEPPAQAGEGDNPVLSPLHCSPRPLEEEEEEEEEEEPAAPLEAKDDAPAALPADSASPQLGLESAEGVAAGSNGSPPEGEPGQALRVQPDDEVPTALSAEESRQAAGTDDVGDTLIAGEGTGETS